MALAATVEWDVRTTGNAANGGGFDPVSGTPGTDYSQQDSAQIAYTDLVIDGTTNTKCTSAGNPFTSAHVGNIINVTGGTGFTVQRVQIMSVTSGAATVDKSLGTLSSTGGTGNLGGALASWAGWTAVIAAVGVHKQTVHIKSGTYTLTSSVTISGNFDLNVIGYNSTHRDDGTKPLLTTATNSTVLLNIYYGAGTIYFRNLSFSNTAGTRAVGIQATDSGPYVMLYRCKFSGFTTGYCGEGCSGRTFGLHVVGCEITGCTTTGIRQYDNLICIGNYFHGNTSGGSSYALMPSRNQAQVCTIQRNIFSGNDNDIYFPGGGGGDISNNTFYATGGAAVYNPTQCAILNNIFWDGNNAISGGAAGIQLNNAFGSNSGADRSGTNYPPTGPNANDITLTVDPFTNAAAGDFTLNNTAGGGAACRGAGFQWS